MSPQELGWLSYHAAQMQSILEIGCWKGRSTKVLLEACPGTVTVVDNFKGDGIPGPQRGNLEAAYNEFLINCGCYGNLISIYVMDSLGAAEVLGRYDMIFIDSCHNYKEAVADIKAWLPKAKRLICGHDYDDLWEVKRAVNENVRNFEVFGSIWSKWV